MSAREEILARVRRALDDDASARVDGHPRVVERAYRHAGEHPPGSEVLLRLLTDRLEDYRAGVVRVGEDDLPAAVARLLAAAGSCVVPVGLPSSWTGWWTAGGGRLLVDDPDAPLDVATLDAADAVLTGARIAVAETGTIVLDAGPDQGRRALTLVPDHHVCVVRAEQVVSGVPEAVALLDPTRPMTWISGPSATSDIELQRVEGVHGPRTLDVVLLTP